MNYQVVTAEGPVELQAAVLTAMEDGWVLQGGVSVSMIMYEWENERKGYKEADWNYFYAQAMVKP